MENNIYFYLGGRVSFYAQDNNQGGRRQSYGGPTEAERTKREVEAEVWQTAGLFNTLNCPLRVSH